MKKLALVIVLAVVASRLLAVASDSVDRDATRARIADLDRRINDRLVRLTTDAPPEPPKPPKPPKPPRGRRVRAIAATTATAAAVKSPVMPAWFPKTELEEEEKARADSAGVRVLVGRLSASEDRALLDLRKTLEREVGDWLAADVPPSWRPAPAVLDRMVLGTYIQPVTRNLKPAPGPTGADAAPSTPDDLDLDSIYTLHRAGQKLDFSPSRRSEVVETYRREIASWRMKRLGGGLAAALACLLVLTTYIRADVATKGYYTNRLRLLAAAGLGAAGLGAYRLLG